MVLIPDARVADAHLKLERDIGENIDHYRLEFSELSTDFGPRVDFSQASQKELMDWHMQHYVFNVNNSCWDLLTP